MSFFDIYDNLSEYVFSYLSIGFCIMSLYFLLKELFSLIAEIFSNNKIENFQKDTEFNINSLEESVFDLEDKIQELNKIINAHNLRLQRMEKINFNNFNNRISNNEVHLSIIDDKIYKLQKLMNDITDETDPVYLYHAFDLMTTKQLQQYTTKEDFEKCHFEDNMTRKEKYIYSSIRTLFKRFDRSNHNNTLIQYMNGVTNFTKEMLDYVNTQKEEIQNEYTNYKYDSIIQYIYCC